GGFACAGGSQNTDELTVECDACTVQRQVALQQRANGQTQVDRHRRSQRPGKSVGRIEGNGQAVLLGQHSYRLVGADQHATAGVVGTQVVAAIPTAQPAHTGELGQRAGGILYPQRFSSRQAVGQGDRRTGQRQVAFDAELVEAVAGQEDTSARNWFRRSGRSVPVG